MIRNKTIKIKFFKKLLSFPLITVPLFVSTCFLLFSNYWFYSFSNYEPRPKFWDLYNDINLWWPCFKKVGLDVFGIDPNASITSCANFNYGYFSIFSFAIHNLLTGNIIIWGVLQIALFVFLFSWVYLRKNLPGLSINSVLALLSPGIFLLFASGNMDIEIICLIFISSILVNTKKEKAGLTIICLTVLFKFYTFPLMILILIFVKRKTSLFYGCALIVFSSLVILYQFITNPPAPFPSGGQNKFGAMIVGNYSRKLGMPISNFQALFLGIFFVILILIFMCYLYVRTDKPDLGSLRQLNASDELILINFLFMSLTSVTCYFLALNVDYRLTFIILSGISLSYLPNYKIKYITKIFPFFWQVSLWFVFPFFDLEKYIGLDLQPIGDISLIGTIAYIIFQSVLYLKLIISKIKLF
jgi:hypothetical protein